MSKADVSVVICSHRLDRLPWLLGAVASVERQSLPVAQVVVVVDGNPELAAAARASLEGRCTVVARDENGGLSAARNSGLSVVDSGFVAFLDDDAEAERNWLEEMARPLADPRVLGAGGLALPRWDGGVAPDWFPPELLWAVGCGYRGLPTEAAEVRNVFGGCALYRRSVFETVGGFDGRLGRTARGAEGCEETELCLRARSAIAGGRFVFTPRAIIHHHVPSGRARPSYVLKRAFAEGRSKALLAGLQPGGETLSPERRYLRSSLAQGIGWNLVEGIRSRSAAPLERSALVALSLAAAGAGYVVARVRGLPLDAADGRGPGPAGSEACAATADGRGLPVVQEAWPPGIGA